ncbi:hypothetical protein N7539_005452 [Penicillium diatomitis]|uniref:Mid2 domain-containing protein n=1 Tax=Penicillium diatomitis TaxID=2819901 RepID=A0A9W9X7D4_9EURO|nr:uncharacterized protein N7539_005452 [Penicillium diatomitis]KAJ5485464.1 hypothetical protein N7539_005452 [Penicillium diatomitis]
MWRAFLLTVLFAHSTTAATTSLDTAIQNSPEFIGWQIDGTKTSAHVIPSSVSATWTTKFGHGFRCPKSLSSCDEYEYPVNCENNILTYVSGGVRHCATTWSTYTTHYSCGTITILGSDTLKDPPATSIGCVLNWSAWTLYRALPTPTDSSASTSSTSASTASSALSTPSITPPPQVSTTMFSRSSTTSSPTGTPPPADPEPKSKAWIAGAVVGPVAGIALLAGLAWFIYRQKRRRSDAKRPNERFSGNPLLESLGTPPLEMPTDRSRHEMASNPAAQKLDPRHFKGAAIPPEQTASGTAMTHELDATSLR